MLHNTPALGPGTDVNLLSITAYPYLNPTVGVVHAWPAFISKRVDIRLLIASLATPSDTTTRCYIEPEAKRHQPPYDRPRTSVHRHGTSSSHSMPPTTPTKARVPTRTLRTSESVSPRHGCACARSPSTSSPRRRRSAASVVASTNESSVSRSAERELRFVDPNRVRTGGAVGVGRTHMPGVSFQPS